MSGSRGAWMIEAAVLVLFHPARHRPPLRSAPPPGPGAQPFPSLRLLSVPLPSSTSRTSLRCSAATPPSPDAPPSGPRSSASSRQRPWFGYGYDAFWRGMQGPSFQIAAAVHFVVAHAHNGFLEIALELGAAASFSLSSAGFADVSPSGRSGYAVPSTASPGRSLS